MDIFCQIKTKLSNQIIEETTRFFVLHDGYPLCEGHLLIVPKDHVDCLRNLDKSLQDEFLKIKHEVQKFLRINYCDPVFFEHGVVGQSVPHAHLQILPTSLSILDVLKKHCSITKKLLFKTYLYYSEKGKDYYFKPNGPIPAGFLHSTFFAPLLRRPIKGIERAKELNEWYLKVKKKWDRYV